MKKGALNTNRGFTIIEVALVLAIAGLIFLMVFVALPGLRTSQRDAARREDISAFLESVKKYQTNNRGALPDGTGTATVSGGTSSSWKDFYGDFLGDKFTDPSGNNYQLDVIRCGASTPDAACSDTKLDNIKKSTFPYNNYTIIVVLQAQCDGDTTKATANPRKLAALYKLEGAGIYCANS